MTDDHTRGRAGGTRGDEVHALAGAYALDALDDVERARFERHLSGCPACAADLRSCAETAARLGDGVATAPPTALKARVMADIGRTRQLPPIGGRLPAGATDTPAARSRTGTGAAARWLAAAASVLFLASVGLGGLAWSYRQDAEQARAQADGFSEVLAEADTMLQADFTTAGHGTMVVSGQRFLIVASDLPDLPAGQVYKLWFIDEEGPRPSVPLTERSEDTYLADAHGFRAGDEVAITVEDDPDTTVPQGDVVMQTSA